MHFHYTEVSQIQRKAGNTSLFMLASALVSKILGNPINFQYVETNLLFAVPI
jgi:hypothetical protein